MKIPKPHHSSALDSLEFKRTRQLMWQDIQKKARPGRVVSWSWDFSLVFKRLGGALAVGVILGVGFANFGSVLSPEAYADYTLTYEPGEEGEAPRFVLESKGAVDLETLSEQISFFPIVNYTIQRVDEDTVEIVLDRELEEEVQYKIALDDKPSAKSYEWTYEADEEEMAVPEVLVPQVEVILAPELEKVQVEPENVEEKEPEEERSSGWNLPFFQSLTAHEEEPVVVEIPEEVEVESEQSNGFPQIFPVLESTHVQTSSGVVEVGEPVVVTPIVETLPVTTAPTPVMINPVVTPVVVTPSSIPGPVTIPTTPTPVTTAPVPTTTTTTQTAPVTIPTTPTPVTTAPVTPIVQTLPVVLLPDLTIERPSLTASTGILKMWIANRSGVAIGAQVDSQISVTLDGAATPQWIFKWSTIINKILIETGVYEIQTKVKVPVGHTVKICVDAQNEIKESNEENNCWEVRL